MIRGSRVGRLYESATFDSFIVTDENRYAVEACRKVVEGSLNGVVLLGPAGTGKTHLCVAMAKAFDGRASCVPVESAVAVQRERLVLRLAQEVGDGLDDSDNLPVLLDEDEIRGPVVVEYWPILDLVSELRNEAKNGEQVVSRRCCRCSLLILDDFGQERATDFVFEELERIIDWRYRDQRPIAVSSNLTLDEIIAKYGNRAVSRWSQQCRIVEIGGADMRTKRLPA